VTLPALATVKDVEVFTGPLSDEDAARVAVWLDQASAAVRRFTGQTISLVEDDEVTFPSTGTTVVVLGQRPVRSVSDVWVEMWPQPWQEVDPVRGRAGWADPRLGHFTWDAYGRLTRLDGMTWGRKFDPVTVIYTHGWDPIPADIVGLLAAKVASFRSGLEANPEGLKSLQVGAMSQSFANIGGSEAALGPGALTKAEQDALRDYRQTATSAQIGAA
jgi:hypothetical protein